MDKMFRFYVYAFEHTSYLYFTSWIKYHVIQSNKHLARQGFGQWPKIYLIFDL